MLSYSSCHFKKGAFLLPASASVQKGDMAPWCWGLGLSSVTGTRDGNGASTTPYMGFLCTATDKHPCARAKSCLFPSSALSMACQHPASPGSISLQEESSCRLHCKITRGLLLGYSRNKQLLLRLSQAFAAKPVPGAAPFAILSSLAPRAVQGRKRLQGEAAIWGLLVGFPSSFLYISLQIKLL